MHAFEGIVRTMLESEDWWVIGDYRVHLTPEEKRKTGKPTRPTPAIDLVAFRPPRRVAVIECKAYAGGLDAAHHVRGDGKYAHRYPMFSDALYRPVLLDRLHAQLRESELVPGDACYELWLVARYISPNRRAELDELFAEPHDQPWRLLGQEWLEGRIEEALKRPNPGDAAVYAFQIAAELVSRKDNRQAR